MLVTCCTTYSVLILFSIKLVVGSKECPPWFTLENITGSLFPQCVCSTNNQPWIICDQILQKSYINLGHCTFQDTTTNGTLVTICPYVFPKQLIIDERIPLPSKVSELNSFICGNLNREIGSYLCGRCTNGTYWRLPPPAVSSKHNHVLGYHSVQNQHHCSTNGTLCDIL